jgi:serine/threonine-protein kinase
VKVLRANGPLVPEAAKRFRREAHLASTLAHPNIVRVLDYGFTYSPQTTARAPWAEDPDKPVPYLAMEYVFGVTLKELARRLGPLPLDWVWRIGSQLCVALSAAHAVGIVHRDVKPQNVMVLDARMELLARLTDFGIARQVGVDLTTLTATGQVIGTPDYLSPEQVLGEPGGPASDLYSLGIVLYELLTARLPFEAETPLAAASQRMVADPPPLTAFRRDIPLPLQEVVMLALRREPDERFTDASEFAQALRWSREQSPPQPTPERGGWAFDARPPQPPQPQPALAPIDTTPESPDREFEMQSTVLRVTSHLPELEGRVFGPDVAQQDSGDDAQAPAFPDDDADDDADPHGGWGDDGW